MLGEVFEISGQSSVHNDRCSLRPEDSVENGHMTKRLRQIKKITSCYYLLVNADPGSNPADVLLVRTRGFWSSAGGVEGRTPAQRNHPAAHRAEEHWLLRSL